MTANWFEAKVKYVKVGEDGKEKKKTENSFTISKVTEYIQEHYAAPDQSIDRIAD